MGARSLSFAYKNFFFYVTPLPEYDFEKISLDKTASVATNLDNTRRDCLGGNCNRPCAYECSDKYSKKIDSQWKQEPRTDKNREQQQTTPMITAIAGSAWTALSEPG